jgi:hypothetical protein
MNSSTYRSRLLWSLQCNVGLIVSLCAVFVLQSSKGAPNIVSEWSSTKASTEQTMKLMQMYKDLGDFEGQVR